MKRFYWLYAEPTPEETEKKEQEEKEKALMEKLEKSLSDKYDNIIKGYQEEITKLKEDLEKSKSNPPKIDEDKKENPLLDSEEILKNLKETNNLFVENKKTELMKKYNITEEDLSTYNTIEALKEIDKIYDKAFNNAKATYTSDEKIVEELKKRKKMVVDLDDGLGEKAQKQTQDKRTKGIMSFLSR